jgi:hypothetical protein
MFVARGVVFLTVVLPFAPNICNVEARRDLALSASKAKAPRTKFSRLECKMVTSKLDPQKLEGESESQ